MSTPREIRLDLKTGRPSPLLDATVVQWEGERPLENRPSAKIKPVPLVAFFALFKLFSGDRNQRSDRRFEVTGGKHSIVEQLHYLLDNCRKRPRFWLHSVFGVDEIDDNQCRIFDILETQGRDGHYIVRVINDELTPDAITLTENGRPIDSTTSLSDLLNRLGVDPARYDPTRVEPLTQLDAPHKDFLLVTLSGASGAGKDVILDVLLDQKIRDFSATDTWAKYTTRQRRASDDFRPYYRFTSEAEFDREVARGEIIFHYYKRRDKYGFSREYLHKSSKSKVVMFAIFTEFERLPQARQQLKQSGINVFSVLIEAEYQELMRRSRQRGFSPEEQHSRERSFIRDIGFLERNRDAITRDYDLIVKNGAADGSDDSKNLAVRRIVTAINALK